MIRAEEEGCVAAPLAFEPFFVLDVVVAVADSGGDGLPLTLSLSSLDAPFFFLGIAKRN
jgi:hypothetical protein